MRVVVAVVPDRIKPVLRYPGAKHRLADWIVSHMPPHDVYLEPFFGSGAVLFAKAPARVETVNDLDSRIVNLFRVIRERPAELAAAVEMTPYARKEYELSGGARSHDPVENARRFLVSVWMGHGGKSGPSGWRNSVRGVNRINMPAQWASLPNRLLAIVDRLKSVHIECRPALEIIAKLDARGCLIYADPPYPNGTLNTHDLYVHEMTDAEHSDLLDALNAHRGPVLLSGYRCALYDDRLAHWRRVEMATVAYRGSARTEVLWLNPIAAAAARQQTLFDKD